MRKIFACLFSLLAIGAMAGVRPTHYDYYGWNEKWSLVGDFGEGVFLEPFEYIVPDNENTNCGYYIFDGEKYFIGTDIPVSLVSSESYTDVSQISLKAFAAAFEGLEVVVNEVRVGDVVFTPTNVKLDYDPQMLGEESATEEALTFSGNASGKVSITMSVSGRVAGAPIVSFYSISVTHYAPNEARNLAYSASEATAVLGEEFTAPVLSGATQNVEYTSSNPYIAMVKRDGTVVPLSSGETVITARGPEDNMYHAEEVSYNLTVKYTSTTEGTSDTVQVDEAGGLRLAIADLESTRIRELTIRGKLNAADLKYLHEASGRLANLESLDLSQVTLVSGDDPYMTFSVKITGFYNSAIHYTCYLADSTYIERVGSELNGLGGSNGYYNCYGKGLAGMFYESSLKRIVLPGEVKEIGMYAFNNSEKLVEVVIPSDVDRIGECAFADCKSLTSIVMPNAVTELSENMFAGCEALTNVGDLSNITRLGKSAFEGCLSLIGDAKDAALKLNSLDTIPEKTFDGCTELSDVCFSDDLSYIGKYAFRYCEKLTSLTFPNTLKHIDYGAFSGCTALEAFNYPTELERVAASSFSNTPWYEKLIKDGVNEILYLGKVALAYVFDESYTDIELNFKEGTICIADGFSCNINNGGYINSKASKGRIKKITLPSSLRRIGDYAFSLDANGLEYNANITDITLPEGLEEIGDYAFSHCELLNAIEFPASLKHIGVNAFAYCQSITTLDLPSTIETIETYAFRNCESLARVRYDVPNAKGNSLFLITAGAGCTADKVVIGPNVEVLPYGIFANATNLVKVEFEERDSTTHLYVDDYAFSSCSNLMKIELPFGTDSIGSHAFYKCTNLTAINFPEGLLAIKDYSFKDCSALSIIDFPSTLQELGYGAFRNLSLQKIMVRATIPPSLSKDTYTGTSRQAATFSDYNAEVHIPQGTLADYQATDWGKFNLVEDLPGTAVDNVSMSDIDISVRDGMLHVTGYTGNYRIYNMLGKLVYEGNATSTLLPAGIYMVDIEGAESKVIL